MASIAKRDFACLRGADDVARTPPGATSLCPYRHDTFDRQSM